MPVISALGMGGLCHHRGRAHREGTARRIPGGAGSADTLAGMKILVTGGAGYIGSTTAKALEEAGHVPVVLDSLLTGPLAFVRDRIFYEGDIADRELLARIVEEHPDLDATIHMAARIVVPESVEKPYEYYRDNVAKSLELFDQLVRLGKPRVLFSSSASLYAIKDDFEVTEDDPLDPTSPYARTKRMIEQVLTDMAVATDLRAIILRYFNPIGSDPDLESGIYAKEPSHVLGQLVMAARGQKPSFTITGTEHPTRDGTGIRDYIHVWDLAQAHVRAVERFDQVLETVGEPSVVINVGRGDGVTVRELVAAFERVFGKEVPVTEAPPRPGDAVGAYANVDRSAELLDWHTELSIDDAIASALAWGEKRHEVLGYE
jgi:UDP-glucose 4-epimerase